MKKVPGKPPQVISASAKKSETENRRTLFSSHAFRQAAIPLEPHNANTRSRYIYIHGTNDTELLGTPASHGCIRLSPRDMMALFALAEEGMDVFIQC